MDAALAGKRIRVVYTGGTLGMVPSPRGYVPAPDIAALIDARVPELRAAGMPALTLETYATPIDSANAMPRHWYALAAHLSASAADCDGFVVIHGTDTLAYTASALSFLLAGLDKPVVLTGAQIPLHELRNDAQANLVSSVMVAGLDRAREVSICFGRRLLRGNRATKVRSTALDAFDSPNCPPLADLGTAIRFRSDVPPLPVPAGPPDVPAHRHAGIAVLPMFPGVSADLVRGLVAGGARGLVLEAYGMGNAPDADPALMAAVGDAVAGGTIVVAISQCLQGNVDLGTYASGHALAERGVVGGRDLTREAAMTKLHVLLARGLPREEIAAAMTRDLAGELTAAQSSP